MYIRLELEPTGWDSEGCVSEYLWYKLISAKSSRSFLSPSIDCTSLGKWSPSCLWQFTGTVKSSQEESPISPPEILLLPGSLPGISPSSFPVRCPWYLLYSTLVIYCGTKPVRLSFRLVLWVIGCLKTTILFCSQFLRSGLWEGLGWVHSFGVCPQGCPHIAGWSLETHARLWLENPQLALLHGWGFLPHCTWILGRVSENKCSERHTQTPQSYFLPGLELPHITYISFLLVLTLNLPLPLLLKETGAWTRGIRAWSPDPRGRDLDSTFQCWKQQRTCGHISSHTHDHITAVFPPRILSGWWAVFCRAASKLSARHLLTHVRWLKEWVNTVQQKQGKGRLGDTQKHLTCHGYVLCT